MKLWPFNFHTLLFVSQMDSDARMVYHEIRERELSRTRPSSASPVRQRTNIFGARPSYASPVRQRANMYRARPSSASAVRERSNAGMRSFDGLLSISEPNLEEQIAKMQSDIGPYDRDPDEIGTILGSCHKPRTVFVSIPHFSFFLLSLSLSLSSKHVQSTAIFRSSRSTKSKLGRTNNQNAVRFWATWQRSGWDQHTIRFVSQACPHTHTHTHTVFGCACLRKHQFGSMLCRKKRNARKKPVENITWPQVSTQIEKKEKEEEKEKEVHRQEEIARFE